MDKYNSCQPGIWNKNGLRDVNCSKSEPLYVNAPDMKSYQGLFLASNIIEIFFFKLTI